MTHARKLRLEAISRLIGEGFSVAHISMMLGVTRRMVLRDKEVLRRRGVDTSHTNLDESPAILSRYAELVAEGLSKTEIAKALSVGVRTVKRIEDRSGAHRKAMESRNAAITAEYNTGRESYTTLGEKYGLTRQAIGQIVRGSNEQVQEKL